MLALLQEVVDIDSGSYDKAGVDAVGQRFAEFFAEHGLLTSLEANGTYGDAVHVRLDDVARNEKPVLLMGHRDTVFPKGEVGRRPFRIDGTRAYGPGVADMKAGLVMNAFVLAAMKKFGSPVPVIGLITSDEEIASPSSRPIIERVARGARAVLNAEPGRPSGNIVTGRKGGVFMAFEVTGKAAHSGGNFEKGISAIGEMAHKIVALHALTGLRPGITVNVGLVKGGQSVNTTAPSADGQIDLRYVKPEDRTVALAAIEKIMATSTVKGASARFEIRGEFLPLNAGEAAADLFETYKGAASDAGLTVDGEFTGGCADSGFTAAVGCPTLCATGPVGANAHTPEEYLEIETIVPRAQATALTILRMPAQG
ncbi:MAG: M20 family peptidase [Hyphomicrobiales bacterium]|nr:MAG: M20 family peptidase [Hyphomicrobiales bacterium]